MSENTQARLESLEKKFEQFLENFKNLPTTLALIQKDISLNAGLADKVEENTKDITKLKAWKSGILMVITVLAFGFGYFISLLSTNLELSMEKTAQQVVTQELEKYNVTNND